MRQAGSIKVLVIDDAVETRTRLCTLLVEQAGVQAIGCESTQVDLLRRTAELRPDCIVIDVPVRNSKGFELLAALRLVDGCSALLIVLTNNSSEDLRVRCRAIGVDHFLIKATEFERMVDLVRSLGSDA